MKFCFESVLEGNIVEFAMAATMLYTTTKRKFLKEPRGKFIRSIPLGAKMLLYDHNVMPLESDSMSN